MDLDVKGLELADVLDAMKNQDVRVYNEPRQDRNDESVSYTTIKRVLPVE